MEGFVSSAQSLQALSALLSTRQEEDDEEEGNVSSVVEELLLISTLSKYSVMSIFLHSQ